MAYPTRDTPGGKKIDDGFRTKVTFQADTDVSFWEKSVTPPGIDGGDPIQTSTMFNETWRTMAPRSLKTLTEITLTAAYDPRVYNQIVALCNVKTLITVTFPDLSTLEFWGYLRSFTPGENVEGTQPEATVVIQPTNTHGTTGAEVAPNYITGAGTDI